MRRALRAMTHGMYVLSVRSERQGEQIDEHIVLALAMQCSVEPPRVAFAVSNNSRILGSLHDAGSAVLSILDAGQAAAVRRYGTPGGVRHASTEFARSALGHPIPPEGAFWMELSIVSEIGGGDHAVFLGEVIAAGANADAFEPLTLAASKFPYGG